jgi:Ca2+-binding RTX toxin-like protein
MSYIIGTEGTDLLYGQQAEANQIEAHGGNDAVFGGGLDDALWLGSGDDYADAGAGNDNIAAYAGNDVIHTGAGNDGVDGGIGNDTIFGDAGGDFLVGGAGNDTIVAGMDGAYSNLQGGTGNDVLIGHVAELHGGAGNDTLGAELTGGAAYVIMDGGAGKDVFDVHAAWDGAFNYASVGSENLAADSSLGAGEKLAIQWDVTNGQTGVVTQFHGADIAAMLDTNHDGQINGYDPIPDGSPVTTAVDGVANTLDLIIGDDTIHLTHTTHIADFMLA